jgi:hypothetical protein
VTLQIASLKFLEVFSSGESQVPVTLVSHPFAHRLEIYVTFWVPISTKFVKALLGEGKSKLLT